MTEETGTIVFGLQHLTGNRRGEEESYQGDRISIGRGRNNHCTFDPEKERSVSHRHCEIRLEDNIAVLYDIGSLNGTYVNGRRVRRTPLADGDEIGLGREGPRLRFCFRSGKPAGSPDAPGPQAAEPQQKLGPTAQEARPSGIMQQVQEGRRVNRYRIAVLVLGGIALALAIAAVALYGELQTRITKLEGGASSADPAKAAPRAGALGNPEPGKPVEQPLRGTGGVKAAPPAVVRSGIVSLAVRSENGSGAVREVGAGAVVGPGLVVTTLSVLDDAETLLQREPAERGTRMVLVAMVPGGESWPVTGVHAPSNPGSLPYADLALLALDPESRTVVPRLLFSATTSRNLKAWAPGLSAEDVIVDKYCNARGEPVPGSDPPSLLKISGSLPVPGTPLLAGNDLAGLSHGNYMPGIAVAAPALKAFVEQAEKSAPRRLRGR